MKTVNVSIKGISPLLMHQFPMQPIIALEKKTPEEQAYYAAYLDEKGNPYVPGIAIQRAFISGATYSKGKGRGSLTKVVAACVMITPERVPLISPSKYSVDARPVVERKNHAKS